MIHRWELPGVVPSGGVRRLAQIEIESRGTAEPAPWDANFTASHRVCRAPTL